MLFLSFTPIGLADDCFCKRGRTNNLAGNFTSANSGEVEFDIRLNNKNYHVKWIFSNAVVAFRADGSIEIVTADDEFIFYSKGDEVGRVKGKETGVLTPTTTPGVFTDKTVVAVFSGTGEFNNACGKFFYTGEANFVTGAIKGSISATVFECGE